MGQWTTLIGIFSLILALIFLLDWRRRASLASSVQGPLYRLLDPPRPSSSLVAWTEALGNYREVVGYSALGSAFVRNPESREYLVLHPLKSGNNAKHYGTFDTLSHFESTVLKDPSFVRRILRPHDVATLERRLGPLEPDSVYFPVPYPMLGGSGLLSTYDKGNVWVFLELVGQTVLD